VKDLIVLQAPRHDTLSLALSNHAAPLQHAWPSCAIFALPLKLIWLVSTQQLLLNVMCAAGVRLRKPSRAVFRPAAATLKRPLGVSTLMAGGENG
jgi:hypothetical protein